MNKIITLNKIMIRKSIKYCQKIACSKIYKNSTFQYSHIKFQFSNDNNKKEQDQKTQKDNISKQSTQKNSKFQLTQKEDQQILQSVQGTQNYKIIARKYNQAQVPGLQSRKYSDLNKLQQEIIQTNKFDLFNPQIIPKSGAVNSYVGIDEQLTEISLGGVKIKGKNQVFLSQIDPKNIPADLDIRFDSQKQLKVVGKQTNNQQTSQTQQSNKNQLEMKIQPETIQQKTINEHMEQQFGIGVKGYKYSNWKTYQRWDIFLTLLLFSFLIPIQTTLMGLHQCYKSTKAIQQERMKQIVQLKQRSFQKVLLENKDFNRSL